MITVLTKGDGSSQTFQNSELLAILNSLEAANNTHTEASGVAYIRVGPNRLLLLDVNTTLGRRLLEIYSVSYESTNAFGLKWTSSNVDYDTQGAVNAAGFGTVVSTLASINAAKLFNIQGDGVYLAQTNLVKHQGAFQNAPAELKAFSAGNGCTLAETADTVQLNVTPVQINIEPPPYGHAPSNLSTFAESTIFSYSNQALVFTSPLSTSTANLGSVTFDGIPTSNFEVTHVNADCYSKSEVDALFAQAGGTDLSNYSTTAQIQAMIDSAKQAVLDSILIGTAENLEIDRSVAGQITFNKPSYAWPASVVYTFDGNQQFTQTFDTSQTTVVGTKMPLSLGLNNTTFTMQFEFLNEQPTTGEAIFCFGDYPFCAFEQYQNQSYYIRTTAGAYIEWSGHYTQYVTLRLTLGASLQLFIDDVLKADIPLSQLPNMAQSLYLGSFYDGIYPFTGKIKNFSYQAL